MKNKPHTYESHPQVIINVYTNQQKFQATEVATPENLMRNMNNRHKLQNI